LCQASVTERPYDSAVAYPLAAGFSALIHPDDEPIIAILEQCAEDRRRLGLPSYTRDDLDRLFQVLDAPAPEPKLPPNVLAFTAPRAHSRRGSRR
jgi:hypothetical protein